MSSRTTPSSVDAVGSTLRGTPRSTTTRSGRPVRRVSAAARRSRVTIGCDVPTVVKATSASPSSATRSSRSRASTVPAAVSGRPATSDSTRSRVRLAMIRCSTPRPSRAWATPSPISPAPMTATRVPSRPPGRRSAARATAPCDSEVIPRAMAVSERTRLPVSTAWRNRVPRTGPEDRSPWARSHARRTWPSTSDSPRTAESRPEATENRWSVTSSSNRMVQNSARASTEVPLTSARNSWISSTPSWNRSTTA